VKTGLGTLRSCVVSLMGPFFQSSGLPVKVNLS